MTKQQNQNWLDRLQDLKNTPSSTSEEISPSSTQVSPVDDAWKRRVQESEQNRAEMIAIAKKKEEFRLRLIRAAEQLSDEEVWLYQEELRLANELKIAQDENLIQWGGALIKYAGCLVGGYQGARLILHWLKGC